MPPPPLLVHFVERGRRHLFPLHFSVSAASFFFALRFFVVVLVARLAPGHLLRMRPGREQARESREGSRRKEGDDFMFSCVVSEPARRSPVFFFFSCWSGPLFVTAAARRVVEDSGRLRVSPLKSACVPVPGRRWLTIVLDEEGGEVSICAGAREGVVNYRL